MKRKGTHRPTIEDAVEISGIEILHPGGHALTKRTAELSGMAPGRSVLDVSSGRGTQANYYAGSFGVDVTGIDISEEMNATARFRTSQSGLGDKVRFVLGDSQSLPFDDNTFDIAINECAVGIPDDSQAVLNEMVRVVKPGGTVTIHESTWRQPLSALQKEEISERYGTTPLEFDEWKSMLHQAGAVDLLTEFDQWSKPEMFWDIREDRKVSSYKDVMSVREKLITAFRICKAFGFKGIPKVFENERIFYDLVLSGGLGYALFKGTKPLPGSG